MMSAKIAVEIGDVQKTLMLPMWGRAVESARKRPLLVDRDAVAIMESLDFDFSGMARRMSRLTQKAWIMRSICVDEVLRDFLSKYPRGTVVNLGCGLDTTFSRVDNGALMWYDLDLADVIELRRRFIREGERRRFIAASFLDTGWMDTIRVNSNVIFIAAGLFYYFDEQQVRGYMVRQADRFPGSGLMMDVASPAGVRAANRLVIERGGLDEKSHLRWGLDDPKTILSWDRRFRLLGTHFYFRKRGVHLGLGTRLYGMISDLMKIQYMLHFRLGEEQWR